MKRQLESASTSSDPKSDATASPHTRNPGRRRWARPVAFLERGVVDVETKKKLGRIRFLGSLYAHHGMWSSPLGIWLPLVDV